jgi:hypothetical protein
MSYLHIAQYTKQSAKQEQSSISLASIQSNKTKKTSCARI